MDIRISKDSVKKILKEIYSFFKGSASLPNFWLYIVLSIVLTAFFMVATFPYEVFLRNQLQEMGGNIGKALYVGNIDFSLTDSTNINNLTLILGNGSEVDLKDVNLDISHFSALFKDILKGTMTIRNLKFTKKQTSFKSTVNAKFICKFKSFSDYPSKGKLNLQLQNVILDGLNIKGFDIPPVKLTSLKSDMKIIKSKLTFDDVIITGSDLSGNITGYITISKFAKNSRLNLDIEIDSSSALLENYRIFLGDALDKSDKVKITVRGTLAFPKFDFPKKSPIETPTSIKEGGFK